MARKSTRHNLDNPADAPDSRASENRTAPGVGVTSRAKKGESLPLAAPAAAENRSVARVAPASAPTGRSVLPVSENVTAVGASSKFQLNDDGAVPFGSADPSGARADRALVDRCLNGEVTAWEDLYRQCHDPLCGAIKVLLGPGFHDPNLVDDIAARVWYALVKNDGELLDRFDPCRDLRLGVFFRGLARVELMQYFRAERRRLSREAEVGQKPRHVASPNEWQVGVILDEFTATLTPGEQQFMEEYLLSLREEGDETDTSELTAANIWQRRHRIRLKLMAFFHKGG
jgi:hypothetical protein